MSPVADSLTTRSAWCRVKGFPWWPAEQLLLSNSNAESRRQAITARSAADGADAPAASASVPGAGDPLPESAASARDAVREKKGKAARPAPELVAPKSPQRSGATPAERVKPSEDASAAVVVESIDSDDSGPAAIRVGNAAAASTADPKRRSSDPAVRRVRELALLQRWDMNSCAAAAPPAPAQPEATRRSRSVAADGHPAASSSRRAAAPAQVEGAPPSSPRPARSHKKGGGGSAGAPASPAIPSAPTRSHKKRDAAGLEDDAVALPPSVVQSEEDPLSSSDEEPAADVMASTGKRARESERRAREKERRLKDKERYAKRAAERQQQAVLLAASAGAGLRSLTAGSATYRFFGDDTTVWAKVTEAHLLDAHSFSAAQLQESALPAEIVEVSVITRGDYGSDLLLPLPPPGSAEAIRFCCGYFCKRSAFSCSAASA